MPLGIRTSARLGAAALPAAGLHSTANYCIMHCSPRQHVHCVKLEEHSLDLNPPDTPIGRHRESDYDSCIARLYMLGWQR